jgi:hypothetical protein
MRDDAPRRTLDLDGLRRAVAIYLEAAYPSGEVPAIVRKRLDWPDVASLPELLACRPFERIANPAGDGAPISALRLGNHGYPNMKLQVQPWSGASGYLLSVNNHDQVPAQALAPDEVDRYRALQAENQRIKDAIETAWDREGLPTFFRYLSDYLEDNSAQGGAST